MHLSIKGNRESRGLRNFFSITSSYNRRSIINQNLPINFGNRNVQVIKSSRTSSPIPGTGERFRGNGRDIEDESYDKAIVRAGRVLASESSSPLQCPSQRTLLRLRRKYRLYSWFISSYSRLIVLFLFVVTGQSWSREFEVIIVCANHWIIIWFSRLQVKESNFTKLCETKSTLTVNASFPGPAIRAHKGDTLYVNVYNQGTYGVTIHW